mgnify:CR=1 FL=1
MEIESHSQLLCYPSIASIQEIQLNLCPHKSFIEAELQLLPLNEMIYYIQKNVIQDLDLIYEVMEPLVSGMEQQMMVF